MEWSAPAYLWLALLAAPLVLLAVRGDGRRRQAMGGLIGIAAAQGLPGRGALIVRRLTAAAGFLLLIAALCGPRWGVGALEQKTQGIDIVIALDTSRSMLADDLGPARLAAAKEAVAALTEELQGDRIGLIAFAGSAFLVCPLTTDYGVFGSVLAETDAGSIPLGGSSLAAALKEAQRAFPGREGGAKVLIVISDGEDHGGDYAEAARRLHDAGVTMVTVAAGTLSGGLIPLPQGGFLKDRRGGLVKSRMQPLPLEEISAAAGGSLLDLASGRAVLADLYRRDLASLERKEVKRVRQRLRERFQFPLALALVLLAIEPLTGRRGTV